jgi:chorismate synthase
MSNMMGSLFRVMTFGESHGTSLGAVVDGCPPGLALSVSDIQPAMDRRRPGLSKLATRRKEADLVRIVSGVEGGLTLGTPIAILLDNEDARPGDYGEMAAAPRPSHADLTWRLKYGVVSQSGGGRASARETAARVAAGAVAEKLLVDRHGVEIVAWVSAAAGFSAPDMTEKRIRRADVDKTAIRCPHRDSAIRMEELAGKAAAEGDTVGGIVTCVCWNVPAGWGEPIFNKMHAVLGMAMLSIPAVRGFDIGAGFGAACMRGTEHNDAFVWKKGRLGTVTNRSGGVQGGITNGEPLVFRVCFKPVATVRAAQKTANYKGKSVTLQLKKGRHDACVLPRAVPIVEAMAALVLADMALLAGGR